VGYGGRIFYSNNFPHTIEMSFHTVFNILSQSSISSLVITHLETMFFQYMKKNVRKKLKKIINNQIPWRSEKPVELMLYKLSSWIVRK
jgi:hypothetical protein